MGAAQLPLRLVEPRLRADRPPAGSSSTRSPTAVPLAPRKTTSGAQPTAGVTSNLPWAGAAVSSSFPCAWITTEGLFCAIFARCPSRVHHCPGVSRDVQAFGNCGLSCGDVVAGECPPVSRRVQVCPAQRQRSAFTRQWSVWVVIVSPSEPCRNNARQTGASLARETKLSRLQR